MAAFGTSVLREVGRCSWFVPWYDEKKNVRFFTIGPPRVAPYWFRLARRPRLA